MWYAFLLITALIIGIPLSQSLEFPVTPYGECYQGVQEMAAFYGSNGIAIRISQMDYISPQFPGHVWLQVGPDSQMVDSYYGPVYREGEYGFNRWFSPDRVFRNVDEMQDWTLNNARR